MNKYKVIGFYKFISLSNVDKLKIEYVNFMKPKKILGTLILAKEGVNGMLAGEDSKIDLIIRELEKIGLNKDEIKISYSEVKPFNRLRVKVKEEIISLGYPELSNPNKKVGTYLNSTEWNKLLEDDDLILLDTRNYYMKPLLEPLKMPLSQILILSKIFQISLRLLISLKTRKSQCFAQGE